MRYSRQSCQATSTSDSTISDPAARASNADLRAHSAPPKREEAARRHRTSSIFRICGDVTLTPLRRGDRKVRFDLGIPWLDLEAVTPRPGRRSAAKDDDKRPRCAVAFGLASL